ncbi:cell wall integrity and stress response component 4-like [Haliotis rubra]|uniref:cell wall integrity and stress response component 4-like n=1 Tax=Haliotis rubra TaxID=36100 RepID=UPI001EE5C33C|nr:cell wall integrity and stress response component 4-like [Haliotis rubra]
MTSTTTILKTTSTRSSMSQSTDLTTSSGSSTTSTEESRTMATTETATTSTTDNGTEEATAIISTLGNAAVEVEPVPGGKTEGKMKTFTSHISVRPTFLLQVLDTTSGSPAKSLPVTLYEQTTKKGWEAVEEGCTLDDGHMKLLKGRSLNPGGRYKLHLDTGRYFSQKGDNRCVLSLSWACRLHQTARTFTCPSILV